MPPDANSNRRDCRADRGRGSGAVSGRYLPRRGGFTLIELLIVMAIIAMLVAILAPSLAQILGKGQLLICSTQFSAQLKAHQGYGNDHNDRKPPLMRVGRSSTWKDWVSPNVKYSNDPVGQGILVDKDYLVFDHLLCPSSSMGRDAELDRAAWRTLPSAGSSYAYFWCHSSDWDAACPGKGVTYNAAQKAGRYALAMDINCQAGHAYQGDYADRAWESHPAVAKINVLYVDGSIVAHDSADVILAEPGGSFEELDWFAKADALW